MLENKEGKNIPDVTFRIIEDGNWKNISTNNLFSGKTVIVFLCLVHLRQHVQVLIYHALMS